MKKILVMALVCLSVGVYALSAVVPDPTKEVAGFVYSEEHVMVTYKDGSEFISTAEKMGIREFDNFTQNLSRRKGSPPIVRPNKGFVVSFPVREAILPQQDVVEDKLQNIKRD